MGQGVGGGVGYYAIIFSSNNVSFLVVDTKGWTLSKQGQKNCSNETGNEDWNTCNCRTDTDYKWG